MAVTFEGHSTEHLGSFFSVPETVVFKSQLNNNLHFFRFNESENRYMQKEGIHEKEVPIDFLLFFDFDWLENDQHRRISPKEADIATRLFSRLANDPTYTVSVVQHSSDGTITQIHHLSEVSNAFGVSLLITGADTPVEGTLIPVNLKPRDGAIAIALQYKIITQEDVALGHFLQKEVGETRTYRTILNHHSICEKSLNVTNIRIMEDIAESLNEVPLKKRPMWR